MPQSSRSRSAPAGLQTAVSRRGSSEGTAFAGRASLLCLALLAASPALALDGDRLNLNASSSVTYDDNLARLPSSEHPVGDEILTADIGGSAHFKNGLQTWDGKLDLLRAEYNHFRSENYYAFNASGTLATDIGSSAHAALTLSQAQALAPLTNFQALVHDVVTSRTAQLDANYGLNSLWMVESEFTAQRTTNGSVEENLNNVDLASERVGIAYTLFENNRVGLRETVARATFPIKGQQITDGIVSLYDPTYLDRNLEAYGEYKLTPITRLAGNFGVSNRTYGSLTGANYTGGLGSVSLDTADGGPLSYGVTLRRVLGGQAILASRVVLTEDVSPRVNWEFSSLVAFHGSMDFARRRYSVDAPGYPAHREYESIFTAGLTYAPQRYLSLGFDFNADNRRADPEIFSFVDHRYVLSANFLL